MENDKAELVSIIMLSKDGGRYAEQSIRSVMAQTYKNWELLFYAPYSKDMSLGRLMELREQDHRIQVYQIVEKEKNLSRNMGLQDAKGHWMAFLNSGDLWEPEKLEKQIAFMEEHKCHFSYTQYKKIDVLMGGHKTVVSGPERLTFKDMTRCCWIGYLTVMFDREKIGQVYVDDLRYNNDYALWLKVSEKADCYLLPDCLAKLRSPQSTIMQYLVTDKLNWRYLVYRKVLRRGRFISIMMTLRNLYYSTLKRVKYVRRKSMF